MEVQWGSAGKICLQTEVGRGSFGVVHKAQWLNRLVAVKIFDAETELFAYEAEFLHMSCVRHPNIIELFAVSMDKQSKYLIMEYAKNGTLHDLLHGEERKEYSLQQAFEWALQCAEGVAYLHNMKEPIVLRYMNPQSLLLTDQYRKLKISNVGRVPESRSRSKIERSFCPYLAPEIFGGYTCDDKCDVFSWAIIVWELLTRKIPYSEFRDSHDLHCQKSIGVRPTFGSEQLDNLKLLLIKCWSHFKEDRPSMLQVVYDSVRILSHIIISQTMRKENKGLSSVKAISIEDIKDYEYYPAFKGRIGQIGVAKWGKRIVFVSSFDYSTSLGKLTFKQMYSQLARIRHPNIIELLGTLTVDTKKFLILEYLENCSVCDLLYGEESIDYLPEFAFRIDWALQCAQGVAYMHNMRPELIFRANLLTHAVMLTKDRRQVKICEFISEIYFKNSTNQDFCAYMAPEIIKGQRLSKKSDVFSWASFMWEVLKRRQPTFIDLDLQLNENWPENIKQLITLCRNKRPEERPSMTNVVSKMKEIIGSEIDFENAKKTTESIKRMHDFSNLNFNEVQIESAIRSSQLGCIYKASWHNRQVVVSYESDSEIYSSIRRLSHVSHQSIIKIFGVSLSSNCQRCMISEYAENGTLHEFLHGVEKRDYPWKQALNWAQQCAAGIAHLHKIRSCFALHPDLMPRNLLLTNQFRQLKIYKFHSNGASIIEKVDLYTGEYVAPEIHKTMNCTKESDVFGWGVLLYEIMTRKEPYKQNPLHVRLMNGILGLSKNLPECIKDLIASCNEQRPKVRPTMDEVISKITEIKINKPFKKKTTYLQDEPEGSTTNLNTTISNSISIERSVPDVEFTDITIGKTLGRGSYGIVHKAKWRQRTVAVKEIDTRTDDLKEAFETELRQLMLVSHRNIIKVLATSSAGHLKYLIIEYAKDKSLDNFLYDKKQRRYSEGRALNWALQCAEGIAYLHNLSPYPVLHRDLKPQNLLVTRRGRRLKICDFGTVVQLKTKMTTNRGTPHYMAPEVFQKCNYSEKCDVFSWAIILWEILKRERPFKEFENVHALQYQKGSKGFRPTIPDDWKDSIIDLITSCWSGTPEERPSMNEAICLLKKIIIEGNDMGSYLNKPGGYSLIPEIPFADLNFDKTPTRRGSVVFKKFFVGNWGKRSVVIQEGSISTDEIRKVFTQLSQASHRNIIKLLGTSSMDDTKYLIVDYAKNGTLEYFLHGEEKRRYSKARALSWALQCAEGIAYLHNMRPNSIVHRFLMPQYLLLNKSCRRLKISLSGEGVQLTSQQPTSSNIEPYLAPEVLDGKERTSKCNVFSWGIILWELLEREKPIRNLTGEYPSLPDNWGDSIKILIVLCLKNSPDGRLTMTDAASKLKAILKKPSQMPEFINQSIITPEAQIEVSQFRMLPDL